MPIKPLFYPQIKQTYFSNLQEFAPADIKILDNFLNDITQKDVDFLNTFNPDKLLFNFRVTAGLPNTKASISYGGWENTRIGGHTTGHYLAAVGQALARGYGECKGFDGKTLKQRFDYLIDGLEECQKATGTGFIFGATMDDPSKPERQFDLLEEGKPADTWVPWYTVHKIINGLVEANKSGGSKKALEIGVNFAQWIYARTSKWDEEIQARVLATEYGGMNDCLYELYKCAKTGAYDEATCERILAAAHKFDEIPLFEKVKAAGQNANVLNNRHANTTIPKFVGAMNRYMTLNDPVYLDYAKAFWEIVVNNHTYITGGNSECEHFGEDNVLDKERSNTNCETCNTHNMLKLSRMLFMATGERKYADYYENTFINAILASVNSETGMTLYFQPMATGCFKTYCNPDVDKNYFWCCTGTGLENFTKLGDSIYFHDDKTLVVNQFISSRVEWKEKGLVLRQKADLPASDKVEFVVEKAPKDQKITVAVRSPVWNYQVAEAPEGTLDDGYILFTREWREGDAFTIKFNMNIQAFPLPDNGKRAVAFKYGPVVLAAELGRDDKMTLRQVGVQCDVSGNKMVCGDVYELTGNYGGTSNLPLLPGETVYVKDNTVQNFLQNINQHFEKIVRPDGTLAFKLNDTSWQGDFIFSPYYLINNQRYGIYWIFADEKEREQQADTKATAQNDASQKTIIEGIGIGYGAQTEGNSTIWPFMQEKGTGSTGDPNELTRYAKAGGSFSYMFKVMPGKKNYLVCTFLKADNGKTICIKSGFRKIAEVTLNYNGSDEKYTLEFELPKGLTKKSEIRIGFSGTKKAQSARLASPVQTVFKTIAFLLCFCFLIISCKTTQQHEKPVPVPTPLDAEAEAARQIQIEQELVGKTKTQQLFYRIKKTRDYMVIGEDLDYKITVDHEAKEVIILFEETDSTEDWNNNYLIFPWPVNLDGHYVWTTYGYAKIYKSAENVPLDEYCELLEQYPDYKAVIHGWSLGSAMAKLLARHYIIRSPKGTKIDEFTTFGDVKCWFNPFYSLKKHCVVIREYVNSNDLITWFMPFYRRDVKCRVGDRFSFKKARDSEYHHTHYDECDFSKWSDEE